MKLGPASRLALSGLALTGLMLTGCGCTKQAARPEPTVPAHWQLTLAVSPAVPRQLDPEQFQVSLKNSNGSPVTGAGVKISLAMPGMDMGRNEVAAHMSALGIYTATGRFTMPGRWIVTVRATQGALYQSASFPVAVQQ